jgi:hypothetical protein
MQQQPEQEISKRHKTQAYYFSISPSNQLLTDFYQTSPYVWHSSSISHPWRLAMNGLNIFAWYVSISSNFIPASDQLELCYCPGYYHPAYAKNSKMLKSRQMCVTYITSMLKFHSKTLVNVQHSHKSVENSVLKCKRNVSD